MDGADKIKRHGVLMTHAWWEIALVVAAVLMLHAGLDRLVNGKWLPAIAWLSLATLSVVFLVQTVP